MTMVLIQKLRNRVFEYMHLETKRVFRYMGHPSVHRWWANELVNGKEYPTAIEDKVSLKRCLDKTEKYVHKYAAPQEKKKAPAPAPPVVYPKDHGWVRPAVPMKFKIVAESPREFLLTAEDGRKYNMRQEKSGWSVYSFTEKRFIIRDIDTREHAVIELQIYLDVSPEPPPVMKGEAYFKIDPRIQLPPHVSYGIYCWVGDRANLETGYIIYEDIVDDEDTLVKAIANAAKLAWNEGYKLTTVNTDAQRWLNLPAAAALIHKKIK